MSTLAERIKEILKEQKLKEKELAKALGVSDNYISLLATGRKTQVSLTLAKLLEALYGYSTEWILTGEGDRVDKTILQEKAKKKIDELEGPELLKLQKLLEIAFPSCLEKN